MVHDEMISFIFVIASWMASFDPRSSISNFFAAVIFIVAVTLIFFLICSICARDSGDVEKSRYNFLRESNATRYHHGFFEGK